MWKFLLNVIPGVGPFLSDGSTLFLNLFNFLVKHWIVFLFLAMVGIIVYQNFEKTRFLFDLETIPHLQEQVTQLQTALNTAEAANKTLTGDISTLNVVVGQWKSVSDGLQAKNNELQTTLDQERVANTKKVQNILNTKPPLTCEDSIDFLRKKEASLTW